MPKKKALKVKTVIKPTVKVPAKIPVKRIEKIKKEMPVFEGAKVICILEDRHNATHYHCKIEGGITKHVPRHLFV